ncbi:Armadillo-type [Corchorus capsularis]|uniref:Armadillo-type n=2 Tax=Magnoliopsida TaxID=3398 RepID=A0A1R3I8Y0_COCAP|nr:Armadillo-type [Corchorus capsularis]
MLRHCLRTRRRCYFLYRRQISSSSQNPVDSSTNLNQPHLVPSQSSQPPTPPQNSETRLSTRPSASVSRKSVFALSATLLSAVLASVAIFSVNRGNKSSDTNPNRQYSPLYDSIEHTIHKTNESFKRIVHHAKQTSVAATVLWQSLSSVMSSANHEVRAGFEVRVAALLADIVAANAGRRAAIVSAGGGAVVDWLLDTVSVAKSDGCGTQAEAARALAYLIADPDVRKDVLGRPRAVPNLLRFIFSCQPQNKSKRQHSRRSSFDNSDSLKGRSMLVAAIMDIVTSNCESVEKASFKPSLPGNAEMRDIAAAIQVIEEGGMHLDDGDRNDDDDDGGGRGMKGIGIKILEGTTVLGLSRTSELMNLDRSDDAPVESDRGTPKTLALLNKHDSSDGQASLSAAVVPGLWDDLHCQHVAVPFAAWALANWAMASEINRAHIEELDQDGQAVMTALLAPERSVKWHGSLVARLLLEDRNLPLNDSVSDWASSLLSTASHGSKNEDISLSQMALSALLVAIERSKEARRTVMEKGLELMRVTAKRTEKHLQVQEALAKALELLLTEDMHLSLEESQKWSGILLSWVFGKSSSNAIRTSAIRILSCILEDQGPSSIPISQGWLALLLSDILSSCKASSVKAGSQPKSDKTKTQIDQSNIVSASQTATQLAVAVVNLVANQLGTTTNSVDTFPLADLLSLEPFAGPFKTLKKDNPPKFDVADSALATLKAIKALTEICAEDSLLQDNIADLGVLCLLRRFLLRDDYEKLAAREAYAASRAPESQERGSSNGGESSPSNTNDPSSVRVPPTAHIRRHAARLLTILSLLPKVQKVIAADETWCKWLEDCANGKISGISDLKTRSYARATLLNVICNQQIHIDSVNSVPETRSRDGTSMCPLYDDMIFLINPELPHWKCPGKDQSTSRKDESLSSEVDSMNSDDSPVTQVSDGESSSSSNVSNNNSESGIPQMDIVFVHGLRGGPYKTWRIAEDKTSTKSGLVEKIDEEAGKLGTFWPGEWLSADFPPARLFSLKYKTNLTQWSGASLPLQEVSSILLKKLVAAGIGNRPVVFVTHSMGGLVVKQILHKAKAENMDNLVNNTIGVVFYSCPHFGSKLADMPWRMGLVLRPAPTIGELRSGSPRLVQLNDFLRQLHKKRMLEVLSFCETKVTPIVEGYGGWAFRMEIVPIESAYPGFGELVVLESTDHINSCKPLSRTDPSYTEALQFLRRGIFVFVQSKLGRRETMQLSCCRSELPMDIAFRQPIFRPTALMHCQVSFPFFLNLNLEPRNVRLRHTILCSSNSSTTTTNMSGLPLKKKRKRYRKQYPGENEGITEEMRFVAMRLRNVNGKKVTSNPDSDTESENSQGEEDGQGDKKSMEEGGDGEAETWKPSMEGFLKYLVDSKLVFSTIERIVDESSDVAYAYFRRTGLERSPGLSKDLEWFSQQNLVIPEPSTPGVSYVTYLEELAEKSAPLFLSHYYNIYFSHIAGGQVISRKVSEMLLEGRELEFYKWEGDEQELLKGVRENLNILGEHWSRDDSNKCLKEAAKSFNNQDSQHERLELYVMLRNINDMGLMEHHQEIVKYFKKNGVSAIFLFRRNLLRRMISVLANSYDKDAKLLNGTHKSHVHSSAEAQILAKFKPTIITRQLIPELKQAEESIAKAVEYFNSTRHIVLYYEDLVKNPKKLRDVQEFLGLPYRELTSRQVKIHRAPLSEQVANWDDVEKAVKNSSYQSFLHSDYKM